jgi:hypothetical protein
VQNVQIELNSRGFVVGEEQYYHRRAAALRAGVHPDTLQRLWRDSGDTDIDRIGLKLGRSLFFTDTALADLGHAAKTNNKGE